MDVSLELPFCAFEDLWISPELKTVLEDYLSLHSWVFCLLDAVHPLEDGSYPIESVVSNPKLAARRLQSVQKFLQDLDRSLLTTVTICACFCF